MAKLTTKKRKSLKTSEFAVPGRKYPIEDEAHARNALARVSQFGTAEEKAEVRRAVARKYPHIVQNGDGDKDDKKAPKHRGHGHKPNIAKGLKRRKGGGFYL